MPNKTMLLTGFETFYGEKINPSALAIKEFFTIPFLITRAISQDK